MKIQLEDKHQDFTHLDVDKNGIISGNSIIFSKGNMILLGVGTMDGTEYFGLKELQEGKRLKQREVFVYFKDTKKEVLPWNAPTLKYRVIKIT